MKFKPTLYLLMLSFTGLVCLSSCDDLIQPDISKSRVTLEAPADQYTSTSYTINFWWDEVDHAQTYHLQVVTPDFAAPGSLVLDTVIANNRFAFNLNPGIYQWRVMAENGSSQTVFTPARTFTVAASSVKSQAVQLISPANNYLTNQSNIILQWGSLYGATQYQIEIDTNNFVNENALIVNEVIPGRQLNFTFPKDQVYQWRVRAENDTAQAQWSAINSLTYDHTPPPQVSIVSPANNATIALPVGLQWNAAATAVSYKLYVFKSDSTTIYISSFPMKLTGTGYTFNQGSSGDRVYWEVSAVDAAGNEGKASILRSFVSQ